MAIERIDEVLDIAVETDVTAIPRFDLKLPNGTVMAENVQLVLKNPIIQEGMPVNKVAVDEILAATGLVTGDGTTMVLAQPGFVLQDGATIRFKLNVMSGPLPTINVEGTGAVSIKTAKGKPMKAGFAAGIWFTAVYCEATSNFVLQGDGGDVSERTWFQQFMTNTFNVRGW